MVSDVTMFNSLTPRPEGFGSNGFSVASFPASSLVGFRAILTLAIKICTLRHGEMAEGVH